MATLILVTILAILLAGANGANDTPKGIATLLGSGVTSKNKALLFGLFCTFLGGIAALFWGTAIINNFGRGLVSPDVILPEYFVPSILFGAFLWIALSTSRGWPVSTTHALLGALIGATLALWGVDGLVAKAVALKAFMPLLVSPLIAIVLCAAIIAVSRFILKRTPSWQAGCCDIEDWQKNPFHCAAKPSRWTRVYARLWTPLHWLSAGAISFARGMNDVPKIAAFLIIGFSANASISEYASTKIAILTVVIAMIIGGYWAGKKVLTVMAEEVTRMDAGRGLAANIGTSSLVLIASPLGFPVSTTHVSTGSLFGIRLAGGEAPTQRDALKSILIAWVVTLPATAIVAGAIMMII